MSNAMAIAAVTAVLRELVHEAVLDLTSHLGTDLSVTAVPPDLAIGEGGEGPKLNLFMYQVSQNPGWANVDLPERDGRGRPVANPPMALDLHYMLTAVGDQDYHGDILLGYGMQAMHDYRILPRGLIDQKLSTSDSPMPDILSKLALSGLSAQVEQIKISPDFLDRDQISNIWSSVQASYRPSAFYQASVVLIQRDRPVEKPLPVRTVSSRALPIRRPQIDQILSASGSSDSIEAGDTLEIHGHSLSADSVAIRIDSETIAVDPGQVADDLLTFDLPGDVSPGTHVVQVVHQLEFEDSTGATIGSPRPIFDSNSVALTVRPSISAVSYAADEVTVDLAAPVARGQRIFLVLQPRNPNEADPVSFVVETPTAPTTQLVVAVSGLAAETHYVVRLQVGGVENLIEFDPNTDQFDGPTFETDPSS